MHYKAAIAAQIALLAYFELCVLIPLGRWNAQPGMDHAFSTGNVILGAMIGGAQSLLLVGTIRRVRLLLWLGLVGDTAWLLMHIHSLWVPYIRGASPEYAEMYARVFGSTTKLLPNFADHLAPDAMHISIDVLVLTLLVTLVLHMRTSAKQPDLHQHLQEADKASLEAGP